jgi:hypothetical protein
MQIENLTLTAELADEDVSFRTSLTYQHSPSMRAKGLPLYDEAAGLSFQGEVVDAPSPHLNKWAIIHIKYSSQTPKHEMLRQDNEDVDAHLYLGEIEFLNKSVQAVLNVSKDTFHRLSTIAHSGRLLKMNLSYYSENNRAFSLTLSTEKT